jgi:hypothetical protein
MSVFPLSPKSRPTPMAQEGATSMTVKMSALRYITFKLKGTEKIMRQINLPFLQQMPLDAIEGKGKKSSRLKNGAPLWRSSVMTRRRLYWKLNFLDHTTFT